jgi:hypothetical protein
MSRDFGSIEESLDYLGISLFVSSDRLSPKAITEAIGIEPTCTRERGSPIRGGVLMRRPEFDLNEWQLREQLDVRPGDHSGYHSEAFITQFLDKIKGTAVNIAALSKNHDLLILLVCSVHDMPYIGLTSDHIQAIASLHARLDYDIMVYEPAPNEGDGVAR